MESTITSIVAFVTAASAIATFIYKIKSDSKQRKLDIITNQRCIKYLKLREISGEFIGNAGAFLVADDKRKYYLEIIMNNGVIRSLLTYKFKVDKKIIDRSEELMSLMDKNIKGEKNEDLIYSAIFDFSHLMDVYNATEWERIKVETAPTKKGSQSTKQWNQDFDKFMQDNINARALSKDTFQD